MGGAKSMGSQSQSMNLDPATQARIAQAWAATQAESKNAVPGASPFSQQAAHGYQGYGQAGNLGLGALSGNQQDVQQLMNPYQQQVLDAMQKQFGFQNQGVLNAAADQAQGQNAFGGSRSAIMAGNALSQNMMGQNQQYAGLLSQGYLDAMNQAQNLAQAGLAGNQGMATMGDYLRSIQMSQDPTQHAYDILNQGIRGLPYGQTTTATTTEPWGSAIAGGLLSGAGLAGSLGWKPF